jgi:hypothetical protein
MANMCTIVALLIVLAVLALCEGRSARSDAEHDSRTDTGAWGIEG